MYVVFLVELVWRFGMNVLCRELYFEVEGRLFIVFLWNFCFRIVFVVLIDVMVFMEVMIVLGIYWDSDWEYVEGVLLSIDFVVEVSVGFL